MLSLLFLSSLSLHAETSQIRDSQDVLINPSSRFNVKEGCNMFLTADFLWWSANADGLYFAQSGFGSATTQNPPDGSVDFSGHLQRVKEEWRPGVRVGFGGNMPYDEWDIYLNWTWFQCDPKQQAQEQQGNPLLVLWGHPDVAGTYLATQAEAKWELTINVLDLEMGRSFWVGKYFSIRPYMGIRGAWIDHAFKIQSEYAVTPQINGKVKMKSDFEGVGARAGLDMRFALYNGWSLYGLVTGSLMYGYFNCDFEEKANQIKIAYSEDRFHQGISTIQMGLGTRWDTYFHKKRYHFGISAGWEQNIWYGVSQFHRSSSQLQEGIFNQNGGNLTFQGGTLSGRLDF